jgi:hypothetical protein
MSFLSPVTAVQTASRLIRLGGSELTHLVAHISSGRGCVVGRVVDLESRRQLVEHCPGAGYDQAFEDIHPRGALRLCVGLQPTAL